MRLFSRDLKIASFHVEFAHPEPILRFAQDDKGKLSTLAFDNFHRVISNHELFSAPGIKRIPQPIPEEVEGE